MNQPSIVDVVGLFVLIAATLFSSEVALVVGPYLVIVVSATIGASFAVARREKSTRSEAIFFFARVVGLAVLLTVGAAAYINSYRPDLSPRILVAPIALLIGFIGDQWGALLGKIVKLMYGAIDLFRKGGPHG